jgi:hypothetical protein
MNNWTNTQAIRDWFPKDMKTFAKPYGYSYNRTFETNCHPYKEHLVFEAPGKSIELHPATNNDTLGHITITKELMWNHPLATNTYVTTELNLPLSLTPKRFFPFINEQLINLLERIC